MYGGSCSLDTTRCDEARREVHEPAPGMVMMGAFEHDGLAPAALNGTFAFRFTGAVSLQVLCDTH